MVALAVTVACIPLLVIDLLSSGGSGGAVVASASEPAIELLVPTTEAPPVTVAEVVVTIPAPTTTIAPAPTTTVRRVPQTTTTTRPVVTLPAPSQSDAAFLSCVRWRESRGDYTAVDPSGQFMGAYQIYQGGWDSVSASIGRHDLVGVAPNHASPADQDLVAAAMLARNGRAPWGGACG